MRLALLALTLVLLGCPPVRDDATGEGAAASYLQSAVWFAWGDPTRDYELGALHMLDGDYGCEDVESFDLQWWNMEPGVEWIGIGLLRGLGLDGWAREFPSYYEWSVENGNDYYDSAYFYGSWGDTGQEWGDDDVPIGRDVSGYLGQEVTQRDDVLTVTSHNEARVVGVVRGTRTVDGVPEEYRFDFNALNCGTIGGSEIPPGEDDPPEEEPPQDGGGDDLGR